MLAFPPVVICFLLVGSKSDVGFSLQRLRIILMTYLAFTRQIPRAKIKQIVNTIGKPKLNTAAAAPPLTPNNAARPKPKPMVDGLGNLLPIGPNFLRDWGTG